MFTIYNFFGYVFFPLIAFTLIAFFFSCSEHYQILERETLDNLAERHRKLFPNWFRARVADLYSQGSELVDEELYSLAQGPDSRCVQYTGCMANGVRWSVKHMEQYRTTQNSGVRTIGSHDGEDCNFYGNLISVIKIQFIRYKVILFKCHWYNTNTKRKGIIYDFHLTSVNVNTQWYKDDPYVLPTQAHQVFYVDDPKLGLGWKVVHRFEHRHLWDVPEKVDVDINDGDEDNNDNDEEIELGNNDNDDADVEDCDDDGYGSSLCRHDEEPETIVVDNISLERIIPSTTDFIDDDIEEDEI